MANLSLIAQQVQPVIQVVTCLSGLVMVAFVIGCVADLMKE